MNQEGAATVPADPAPGQISENKLQRIVRRINRLPPTIRPWVLTRAFGHTIPFTTTAGVRNHIGTMHAAATVLLAESATGIVLAMHIPDHCFLLLKSLHMDYDRRTQGALTAVATLDSASMAHIRQQQQGGLDVPVTVSDESRQAPVHARMLWAWVPRRA